MWSILELPKKLDTKIDLVLCLSWKEVGFALFQDNVCLNGLKVYQVAFCFEYVC